LEGGIIDVACLITICQSSDVHSCEVANQVEMVWESDKLV